MTIAAAILAAGGSRRLGRPKQLLPFGDTTLVEAMIARVWATTCDHVGIVVGAHAADVVVQTRSGVDIIDNPHWEEGMGSSVRTAVAWAESLESSGLLLCVVDQPRLTTQHLEALLAEFRRTHANVGSRYDGRLGVPAIFSARCFPALASLSGDRGARAVLARPGTRWIEWADGAFDIDVPKDLALEAR